MKAKISKAKRNNQKKNKLVKSGKIKTKKLKIHTTGPIPFSTKAPVHSDDESDNGEGLLEMVDDDDLKFLKTAVINRSYSILKKVRVSQTEKSDRKRKHDASIDSDEVEEMYENEITKQGPQKTMKMMLPVKTKHGFVERTIEVEENENKVEENGADDHDEVNRIENEDPVDSDSNSVNFEDLNDLENNRVLTTADMLARREKAMKLIREKIGSVCSGVLEDPEGNISNIRKLFQLMESDQVEIWISVRKLSALSLLEVFKDILPSYVIREQTAKEVKLKKDTFQLVKYEETLLNMYKVYLQKLEKMSSVLTPKKGNTNRIARQEIQLAETAVFCLCELLISHSQFNYAKNIVHVLVPFLKHKFANVRQIVRDAIKNVFKKDKKGEITITILRRVNMLVKLNVSSLHPEAFEILLALHITDVNIDGEKEIEKKQTKLQKHKQNVLQLSKKERKRKKKLAELNKELLETKAEESQMEKHKCQTEIIKIVFTIYFRILKQNPSVRILGVVLEGLAKFSHVINIDFYSDLVDVINRLLENEDLSYRNQLNCILTVITILSGQGDVLNIDPLRFYTHLYKNLLQFHGGKSHADFGIVFDTLELVLIKRRKKITLKRTLAFAKRLAIMSLQSLHSAALGCLALVKTTLQMNSAAAILLDCDPSVGEGKYLADANDPEYTNAANSALWELTLLTRSYHPIVRKMAQQITTINDRNALSTFKHLTSKQLFVEFDSSEMAFKPPIPPPVKKGIGKNKGPFYFVNDDFYKYCNQVAATPIKGSVFL